MYRANQHRRRNQPRRATPLGYLVATAACLFCAACRGQPAGGIIPSDSPVVTAALQWARALQSDDEQLFGSTLNPDRLEPPSAQTLASYSDVLVSTFATCGTDAPKTEGLVTDGTRGRERYMVIGRYGSKCLQSRDVPATDTFVVYELTISGTPKIDAWNFGRPPGA